MRYRLAPPSQWTRTYPIGREPAEDVIWHRDVRGVIGEVPDNVADIWQYGFTEMFNNAIEHSAGDRVMGRRRLRPSASHERAHAVPDFAIAVPLANVADAEEPGEVVEPVHGVARVSPSNASGGRKVYGGRVSAPLQFPCFPNAVGVAVVRECPPTEFPDCYRRDKLVYSRALESGARRLFLRCTMPVRMGCPVRCFDVRTLAFAGEVRGVSQASGIATEDCAFPWANPIDRMTT